MRDALGRPFFISRPIPSGLRRHDLVLTIDKDIQFKAQQSLRSAVEKAEAKSGQCLVIDPNTGAVLAMAIFPEFNPNVFSRHKPEHWRNRCITDCFEPGSTIKAFLLAAALEEHVLEPKTRLNCERGEYRIGGRVVHDTHEYEWLSISDIIAFSSNIGAIKMGQRLGYAKFCEYLKGFGFGRKSGIDLLGERDGFIRSAGKARPIDQATLFFGQGMAATSLQLAMAMAAIANGGRLMRPYVVQAVVDPEEKKTQRTSPKVVRRVVSHGTSEMVREILEGVVREDGTGSRAAVKGFTVAGKTGTSQKVDAETGQYSKTKHVATFVGFAPSKRPKLVILVMVDEPKGIPYGGWVAGPVFAEVAQWALHFLRINPQIRSAEKIEPDSGPLGRLSSQGVVEEAQPSPRALRSLTDAGLLPDFRGLGMREVLKQSRPLGLKIELRGTGLAFKQDPLPGVPLRGLKHVSVRFRAPR
jgi:cell division protein FtsI (penicillin-binding protein 3)